MIAPLIDTSILIDVLRKRPEAEAYILSIAPQGLFTHATVVGELLGGIRDGRELKALDSLLLAFHIFHPTDGDSMSALDLLRQFKLSHGTGYLDSLIAATALRVKFPISTLNDKHFRAIPNLQIIRPY